MPKIKEYTQQVSAQGEMPSRKMEAPSFRNLERLGQSISGLGADLGEIQKIQQETKAREEVTDFHAQNAEANEKFTLHLDDLEKSTPPGVDFATQFREDAAGYYNELTSRYETAAGQAAAKRGAAEAVNHFAVQSALAQSRSAGRKAVLDIKSTINSNANVLRQDPTQYERLRQQTIDAVSDTAGAYKLDADVRVKMEMEARQSLAYGAVQGIILKDPEAALKILQEGKFADELTGAQTDHLIKGAEDGIRAQAVEQTRIDAAMIKARKEEERVIGTTLIQGIYDGTVKADDILRANLPPSGDNSIGHYLTVLEGRAKAETHPIRKDASVFWKVLQDIHNRKITTETQIDNVFGQSVIDGRGIDYEQVMQLRKEFADLRTPEGERLGKRRNDFMQGIAAQLDKSNPLMGKIDASGKQQVYEFNYFVDKMMEQTRAKGGDVYALFDPSSKDYLGKPEVLAGFQKTMKESMRDFSEGLRRDRNAVTPKASVPSEKARKPGETIQQYLDRTGKK